MPIEIPDNASRPEKRDASREWIRGLDPPESTDARLQKETQEIFDRFPDVKRALQGCLKPEEFNSVRLVFEKSNMEWKTDPPQYVGALIMSIKRAQGRVELLEAVNWRGESNDPRSNFREAFHDALMRLIEKTRGGKTDSEPQVNFDRATPDRDPVTWQELPRLETADRFVFNFDTEFKAIMEDNGGFPFTDLVHWEQIRSMLQDKCVDHMQGKTGQETLRALTEVRRYLDGFRDYAYAFLSLSPSRAWTANGRRTENTKVLTEKFIKVASVGSNNVPICSSEGSGIMVDANSLFLGQSILGPVPIDERLTTALAEHIYNHERGNTWSEWWSDQGGRTMPKIGTSKYKRAFRAAQNLLSEINGHGFDSASKARLVNWVIREIETFSRAGPHKMTEGNMSIITENLKYRIEREVKRVALLRTIS